MIKSVKMDNCLLGNILSLDFSENSLKSAFIDQDLFEVFGQNLNELVTQITFSYEEPSIYVMSVPNNYE